MRLHRWLCCLLLLACAGPLFAQGAPPPVISLVTFAPGEVYWQRFGHNALLVREPSGAQRLYNYGIFDFQQKNFFLNFARGRMLYRVDEAPLYGALRAYAAEGRWALEQQLALSPQQARELAAFLDWNARPQNADYRYDYFLANCSTKTRDAIDRALGGALQPLLSARRGENSFRSEVLRLIRPAPALMMGMDLGLGAGVDAPLSQWEEAFIPMRLMASLRQVQTVDASGNTIPLVAAERWLLPLPVVPEAERPPRLWPPFLAVGLLLAAVLALTRRASAHRLARVGFGVLGSFLVLVWALAGTVLLLGWVATEHWGMAANRNLLLLHPLWWLLLPVCLRLARREPQLPGRALRALAWVNLGLALLSLPLALLGPQFNLHWVLLLLPAQLVLLIAILRGNRHA